MPYLYTALAILGLLLIIHLFVRLHRLRAYLRYLNMEIGRTTGREQDFWREEKRLMIRAFFHPFFKF